MMESSLWKLSDWYILNIYISAKIEMQFMYERDLSRFMNAKMRESICRLEIKKPPEIKKSPKMENQKTAENVGNKKTAENVRFFSKFVKMFKTLQNTFIISY